MKHIILFLFLIVDSIVGFGNVWACSAFCINKNENMILGKNMDWPVGNGHILINRRGITKYSLVSPGEQPLIWTSKFGNITFNQFGIEFPCGGMNEAGLVIEALNYTPSKYPVSDSLPCINEFQWIQYQLDNHGTVETVIRSLKRISISRLILNLHYLLADKNGNVAVIEFINGKVLVYNAKRLPVNVLSNNSYKNSLKYLRMHEGYGGSKIVRDSPESQERFVRAVMLIERLPVKEQDVGKYAFKILENVRQHDTQWSIVYDLKSGTIVFKLKSNQEIQKLEFADLNSFRGGCTKYIDLSVVTDNLSIQKYTNEKNDELLKAVFSKLFKAKEISRTEADNLMRKISTYQIGIEH